MLCFLCKEEGLVLPFTYESYEKCRLILLFRRKKNYKYKDVHFDANISQTHGYHSLCYKKIVIATRNKPEYEEFCKTQKSSGVLLVAQQKNPPITVDNLQRPNCAQKQLDISHAADLQRLENPVQEPSSEATVSTPATLTSVALTEPAELKPFQPKILISKKKVSCILCGYMEKKVGKSRSYVIFPQNQESVTALVKKAKMLNDFQLIDILESVEIVAYHEFCYKLYQDRVEPHFKQSEKFKKLYQDAFHSLSFFITQEVIEKKGIVYLEDLLLRYKAIMLDSGAGKVSINDFDDYQIDSLEQKIINAFGNCIVIEASSLSHWKKIVFARGMDGTRFTEEILKLDSKHNRAEIALISSELRNAIVTTDVQKVPDTSSIDNIIHDEWEISEELMEFMTDIIVGPAIHNLEEDDTRKLKSACSELIHAATEGKVKPRQLPATIVEDPPTNPVLNMLDQYSLAINYDKSRELHGIVNGDNDILENNNKKRRAGGEINELTAFIKIRVDEDGHNEDFCASPFKKQCLNGNLIDNMI